MIKVDYCSTGKPVYWPGKITTNVKKSDPWVAVQATQWPSTNSMLLT